MLFRVSHVFSFGIIAFWAVMMYSLVSDRIIPMQIQRQSSLIDEEVLDVQWMDIHEWMTIKKNGRAIGAMGLTVMQHEPAYFPEEENSRYVLAQNITLRQLASRINFNLTAHLSPNFNLVSFAGRGSGFAMEGEAQGFVEQRRLYYRFRFAGLSERLDEATPWNYGYMDLDEQALSLQGAVESMMSRYSERRVGSTYTYETLDPFGGMQRQIAVVEVVEKTTITIDGEDSASYRLETTIPTQGLGNIKRNTWVSNNGSTLRTELVMGYTAEKGNPAKIIQMYPWLGEDETVPEFNREEFKASAEQAQSNMSESQSIQNMNFLQLIRP